MDSGEGAVAVFSFVPTEMPNRSEDMNVWKGIKGSGELVKIGGTLEGAEIVHKWESILYLNKIVKEQKKKFKIREAYALQ